MDSETGMVLDLKYYKEQISATLLRNISNKCWFIRKAASIIRQ